MISSGMTLAEVMDVIIDDRIVGNFFLIVTLIISCLIKYFIKSSIHGLVI